MTKSSTCAKCGAEFISIGKAGPPRKHCPDCRQRICPDCGVPITVKGIHRCPTCKAKADAAHAERQRRRNQPRPYKPKPKTETLCPNCGEPVLTTGKEKYCSKACGYEYRDARRPGSFERGYGTAEDRAAMFGCQSEAGIARLAVLDRDDRTSHICSAAIDPDAERWSEGYGTVDHVVPLCKGGPHVWSNVAASHWGCNRRKASKVA